MNLEQVKALGINLSEEDAKKVADASQEELKTFVPKTRFDEVNNAKKQLETDIKERDTQLETIKKSSGDNETLKKQIEDLQKDNKQKDEDYQKELKELQISNAIKLAIADKAQDAELVAGLFDKSKLILGDDGKVTGLDEQVKTLKESKPFLFKEETKDNQQNQLKGLKPGESNTNSLSDSSKPTGTFSMKNAIAAHLQPQLQNENTN